jgi:glucose/arabinose dehydrogenase
LPTKFASLQRLSRKLPRPLVFLSAVALSLTCVFVKSDSLRAQPSNECKPLPPPFASKSVANPPRVIGWQPGTKPTAPPGFEVNLFADKLVNPRWLNVLPNGDVLVSEANSGKPTGLPDNVMKSLSDVKQLFTEVGNVVLLLRDTKGDGKADETHVLLKGLTRPFGMAFDKDRLYVAETSAISIYPYQLGQVEISEAGKKILDLPANGYNNHWTRDLLIDQKNRKLFYTVGSASNVGEGGYDDREPRRAAISVCDMDGKNTSIYASGLRNPVGIAFEPHTKTLWATVNERDGLGDDLVPDYLTSVKKDGFYGWPYSYYGQNVDPRKKGEHPELVAKAIVPDYQLGSHVAALGLTFYTGHSFPKEYWGGAFIGEHGSWNRSKRVGDKVVFVAFKNGKATGNPVDFLTGFINPANEKEVYGRPVGVAVWKDGSLLVADDAGGKIWRVAPVKK